MRHTIETLVSRFERGLLSRRELVSALAALAGATQAAAAPETFRPATLNHVTLSVTNLEQSRAFYQGILQAEVIGSVQAEKDLSLGSGFLALMSVNRPVGIDHFCIGVEGYDANRIAKALEAQGHKPRILTEALGVRFRAPQVYVKDPDGIQVQFSSPRYRGEMPAPK
ncbi:MAG: VOC family protein [Acidobacteria bacterium]|nr:VOC family protein [Acidobacteriota bacterium]